MGLRNKACEGFEIQTNAQLNISLGKVVETGGQGK